MKEHCGLTSWETNSAVAHAVAVRKNTSFPRLFHVFFTSFLRLFYAAIFSYYCENDCFANDRLVKRVRKIQKGEMFFAGEPRRALEASRPGEKLSISLHVSMTMKSDHLPTGSGQNP